MTHKLNNGYMAVEVPEGAKLSNIDSTGILKLDNSYLPLPIFNGQTPVCLASEATEEQAREMVRIYGLNYYTNYAKDTDYTFYKTAIESLHSFCRSINKKPEEVLIIKPLPPAPIKTKTP